MQRTEIRIVVDPVRDISIDDGAGEYLVRIPTSINVAKIADVAIESFHRAVPISRPEDFEITLFNSDTDLQIFPVFEYFDEVFECKKEL